MTPKQPALRGGEGWGEVGRVAGLRWLVLACLAVATCLGGLAPARAQDGPPVLREQIKVYSDLVTLGDLFENAGPAASAPVFRSPDLGSAGVVAAKRVAAAARQHGLIWANPGDIDKVTVERPSRLVTVEEIKQAIAAHAARELDAGAGDLSVMLDRFARPFHVSARLAAPVAVRRLYLQGQNGRFEAAIGFDDPGVRERVYRGVVQETMPVAVPARPIARGATIAADDVHVVRLSRAEVPSTMVTEADALAGMAARRTLAAGQPVKRADLERPRLVQRNALVTVVYRIPGLSLKAAGRALEDAAQGETVAVLNTRSKRTIHGVVRGPGLVAVEPAVVGAPAGPAPEQAPAPHSVR